MNRPLAICVVVLLLVASAGIFYKVRYLKFSLLPRDNETMWQIEGRIQFEADGGPVRVSLAAPQARPGYRVLSLEELSAPGYSFSFVGKGDDRRAEWRAESRTGLQTLMFLMKIYDTEFARDATPAPRPELGPEVFWEEKSHQYIAKELLEYCAAEARADVKAAAETGDTVNETAAFIVGVIRQAFNPPESSRVEMMLPVAPTTDDRIRLLRNLLRESGIPSRITSGVHLADQRMRTNLVKTIEAFYDGAWHGFDVKEQKAGFPAQFLALRRGGKSLLDVEGGSQSGIRYSVSKTTIPAPVLTAARNDALGRTLASLSVYDLPLDSQNAFKRIALLPLGILIIVVIRNLIGIQTMGTFTPVLIALAFTDTTLVPGLVSFVSIVAVGMVIRSYLTHLNLLLVPRIGAVVMVVIFLMKSYSLLTYKIGFTQGLTVTMFPLIILAWVIERAAIVWEEDGPQNTIRQLVASLASGILCYGAMSNRYIQHFTFAFAEIDLVILALLLLLGCYTGYRLTELRRFSPLVKK